MTQNDLKKAAAEAALAHIKDDDIVGVGTGSTIRYFIEALAAQRNRIQAAIASSEETAQHLKKLHIPVVELNTVDSIDIYIDGADEVNPNRELIKGGGGALTREKILAANAKKFVCIVDESKWVNILGAFPLPVEVIPMARSYIARQIVKLGGQPHYRDGYLTDNGNIILDCDFGSIPQPLTLETALNQLVGVVTNGLFAHRTADMVLLASASGVQLR